MSLAIRQLICTFDKNHKLNLKDLQVETWEEAELEPKDLFEAIEIGHIELVLLLLQWGKIPWNSIYNGISAGEKARNSGHEDLYKALVEYGVRAEFVLSLLGQRVIEDGQLVQTSKEIIPNQEYLDRKLEYTQDGERLLDSEQQGVMMVTT
jgi:hypothetical protein